MSAPRVSVVVPTRNGAATLPAGEIADQLARIGLDESNLPVLQDDLTAMHPPWPVLGKDAGPVLPIAVDLHAPRPLNRSSPSVPTSHSIDRSLSQPDRNRPRQALRIGVWPGVTKIVFLSHRFPRWR